MLVVLDSVAMAFVPNHFRFLSPGRCCAICFPIPDALMLAPQGSVHSKRPLCLLPEGVSCTWRLVVTHFHGCRTAVLLTACGAVAADSVDERRLALVRGPGCAVKFVCNRHPNSASCPWPGVMDLHPAQKPELLQLLLERCLLLSQMTG